MLDAVRKIRNAVATKDIVPELTYYLVKDKFIHASNGHIVAAAPCPDDREYVVPAAMFEKFLAAAEQPKIKVTDEGISISSKSFRGRIQKVDATGLHYGQPEGERVTVDDTFFSGLATLRPFVSDNALKPWAASIYVKDTAMYATNNVVLARTAITATKFMGLLPLRTVDFILARKERLVALSGINQQNVTLYWDDGSWLRTQLVEGEFPEQAQGMLADITADVAITDDWRTAFGKVAQFCDDGICLAPERIYNHRSEYQVEADAVTPVPAGVPESRWNPKFLADVINVATHWQPDVWPKPAPFIGHNVTGVIVGRS